MCFRVCTLLMLARFLAYLVRPLWNQDTNQGRLRMDTVHEVVEKDRGS